MSDKTALGDRMKEYEGVTRTFLPRRTYTIVRLDGRAFHTWTKGMEKPFDGRMYNLMSETAQALCKGVDNCVLAYQQSDEISLLLYDKKNEQSQPWFGANIQKIVSVSAAIATAQFNARADHYFERSMPLAHFDSRVFTIPDHTEVYNYFLWRWSDAMRNSIQSAGQAHFSYKQLHEKNISQVQEMLFQEHGINWSKFPEWNKNGVFWAYDESVSKWYPIDNMNLRDMQKKIDLCHLIPLPDFGLLTHLEELAKNAI